MNNATSVGFVLGVAGATLDFLSGYSILTQSTMSTSAMGSTMVEYNTSAIIQGAVIIAPGVILAVTAVASITTLGMSRIELFGELMVLYGVIMPFIGALMYSGITPMMNGPSFRALACLLWER